MFILYLPFLSSLLSSFKLAKAGASVFVKLDYAQVSVT